jgi:hypothetical protein
MAMRCYWRVNAKIPPKADRYSSAYQGVIDAYSDCFFQVPGCHSAGHPRADGHRARFSVVRHGKAIELVPVPTLAELQEDLRGIDTDIIDDPKRF